MDSERSGRHPISAGMLLYDWRMALALLWVAPAFLRRAYLSRRMEKRHIKKGLVTRRADPDAMQEVLECAPEIKACNQEARFIDDLNRRLDEATASLDVESETAVQAALPGLIKDMTPIMPFVSQDLAEGNMEIGSKHQTCV